MSVYRLRGDVHLERAPTGEWFAVDPLLSRRVRLGEVDARVVRALAQGGSIAALARKTELQPEELTSRIHGLARMYLVQGKRAQARIKLQVEREAFARQCHHPAADEPLQWPMGKHPPQHACVGTGTCCGATFLGPLTQADQRRVAGLRFGSRVRKHPGHADHVVRLGPGGDIAATELFETVEVAGVTHVGMARGHDGRCQAQGDDRLCDIHREHGSAAKPMACRLFPLRLHRSPRGVHVSLLLACDGYDKARDAAEAWPGREGEVRTLLAEGAAPVKAALPFEWTAGLPVAQGAWWSLCDEFFALEPDQADAKGWLAAVLKRAQAAIDQRAAELAEGPELVLPDRLGELVQALQAPEAMYDLGDLHTYAAQLDERAVALQQRGERSDARRLQDLARGLRAQMAGRAGRPIVLEPMAARHLHDIVANDLPVQVALGHLDAGLGQLVRRLLLAEALAADLADRAGRTTVTPADTTRALHVAYRSDPDLQGLARLGALGG